MNARPDIPKLDRAKALFDLKQDHLFDLLVIGGGATGLGIALDASLRGLSVALVEQNDFAKGTSSRATKLVHGGVRYLAQGNIKLVREALNERKSILNNAPHLAQPIPFLMPTFGLKGRFFDKSFYGLGLKLYDLLAGAKSLGKTIFLNKERTQNLMPGVTQERLTGSIQYWDGQFDDSRLAISLARTASKAGATILNHCKVTQIKHANGKASGVTLLDQIDKDTWSVNAKCIVNATGVWVDDLIKLDQPSAKKMISPSQGIHLTVDRDFLPGNHALLIPKTEDGRVLFAVPWLGKVILGTTDTPRELIEEEPTALDEEISFILNEAGKYLAKQPMLEDVRSIWAGVRPLVKPTENNGESTKTISREHTIIISDSGLVSVTGGKWTTYRSMAEDTLDKCQAAGLISTKSACRTSNYPLIGSEGVSNSDLINDASLALYGSESSVVSALEGNTNQLALGLTESMIRFGIQYEGAVTIEDLLARRSRLLFLDAKKALEIANKVANILEDELGAAYDKHQDVAAFLDTAQKYLPIKSNTPESSTKVA